MWAARAAGEPTEWTAPARQHAGHGWNLRLAVVAPRFQVVLGCGPVDDERSQELLSSAQRILAAPLELGAVA